MNNYIYLGKITTTHGIKGELKILSDFERKDKVFTKGFKIYIGQNFEEHTINSFRHHQEYEMVTIDNLNNINDVLKYKNQKVYINKTDLNLTADDYLIEDLKDFTISFKNNLIGKITDIVYNNSYILLQIAGVNNFYIPYNKEFIKNIDLTKKIITVENIEGLMQ